MKTVKKILLLTSIAYLTLSSFTSSAYCVASTTCKNGKEIYCSLPAFNYFDAVVINPFCESKFEKWVSCQRTEVNGVAGVSQFISCSDNQDEDYTVDSNGNRY